MSLLKELPEPVLPNETRRGIQARELYHVLKIVSEFVEINEGLHAARPAISIYGSTRMPKNHPDHASTLRLAHKLSDAGLPVIFGGGSGIMEATSKSTFADANPAVRLNIVSPHEQKTNPYQDSSIKSQHFFPYKVMPVKHIVAHVVMPGNFGVLDELFENLTLMQIGRTLDRPTILVDKAFQAGPLDQTHEQLLSRNLTLEEGLNLIRVTGNEDETIGKILAHYKSRLEDLSGHQNTWPLGS